MLEKYKNLELKTKLNIGFSMLLFFVFAVSIVSIIFMYSLYNSYNQANEKIMGSTHDLSIMMRSLSQQKGSAFSVVLNSEKNRTISQDELDMIYEEQRRFDEAYQSYLSVSSQSDAEKMEEFIEEYYHDKFGGNISDLISGYEKDDRTVMIAALDSLNLTYGEIIEKLEQTFESEMIESDNIVEHNRNKFIIMALAIISLIVIALFTAMSVVNRITRSVRGPVTRMSKVAGQVADTGNLNFTDQILEEVRIDASYSDEVGRTTKAFSKMMDDLIAKKEVLEKIAAGDLTVRISVISPDDTLGNSINSMIDSLREMVEQIENASSQINKGAKQLSNGAQILAQGAAEQSSSIEHLESFVRDVNDKAESNQDISSKATEVAQNISKNAADGRIRMNKLRQASQEVYESNHAIEKVTKAVEDIAFQTNMLSLNAAIEAARAGVHGKGFSVVSDEVRNLAGKSSEAANETSAYIEESIEKTELSAQLAEEASESFDSIADGIDESAKLAHELSEYIELQKKSIENIQKTITQLSDVIHGNSSAAEETAASTEEMSSQTEILKQMVSGFILDEKKLPEREELTQNDEKY